MIRLADKTPKDEDVKAGWTAFILFLLLIAAVVVLAFSLVKQLRKAQAAKDAGVYGDEPEDPDGTDSPAGQARRTPALRALRRTWGDEASNSIPVSAALEETLPPEAALVMGAAGSDQHRLADRPWELVQDVRRVVLPFSDRAL